MGQPNIMSPRGTPIKGLHIKYQKYKELREVVAKVAVRVGFVWKMFICGRLTPTWGTQDTPKWYLEVKCNFGMTIKNKVVYQVGLLKNW